MTKGEGSWLMSQRMETTVQAYLSVAGLARDRAPLGIGSLCLYYFDCRCIRGATLVHAGFEGLPNCRQSSMVLVA